MTAVTSTATPGAAHRVAAVARAIEPVLNRVVLAGAPVIELLTTSPPAAPPDTFATDSVLQLLTTAMIDRIATDLHKLGCSRISHGAMADRWWREPDLTFDLVQVHTDTENTERESPLQASAEGDRGQLWLEYATLLTMPHVVDERITVRVAGAPSMLALECASFRRQGGSVADSAPLERAVLLVAARPEIERELASAPPELRSFVASTLETILRSDALPLLVARTLPDTAVLPALAARLVNRLRRMTC